MRDILFRGKRLDSGQWVEGGYKHEKVGEYTTDVFIIESLTVGVFENHRVVPNTVGQYTGLTDKNGTKIFEGDILKQYGFCYVVSFENGAFVAYETPYNESAILPRTDWGNAVVVGNIHDNPELLKGGEQE